MNNSIKIDPLSPNSHIAIQKFLNNELKSIIAMNRTIIFLCIGNDRSTGDSLGPLIGDKLKSFRKSYIYIYGTLDNPIYSDNLSSVIININSNFNNPYIIPVYASLGNFESVGKIFISKNQIFRKGLLINKQISGLGNINITGVVNIASCNLDFTILQCTRLSTVMSLADCIINGISNFILESSMLLIE